MINSCRLERALGMPSHSWALFSGDKTSVFIVLKPSCSNYGDQGSKKHTLQSYLKIISQNIWEQIGKNSVLKWTVPTYAFWFYRPSLWPSGFMLICNTAVSLVDLGIGNVGSYMYKNSWIYYYVKGLGLWELVVAIYQYRQNHCWVLPPFFLIHRFYLSLGNVDDPESKNPRIHLMNEAQLTWTSFHLLRFFRSLPLLINSFYIQVGDCIPLGTETERD